MKWRKIRIWILACQGIVYRCFIICCNTTFFLIGIRSMSNIFGEVSFTNALKYAFGVSLTWNVINTVLYFLFHYIYARMYKLGTNNGN